MQPCRGCITGTYFWWRWKSNWYFFLCL